MRGRGAVAWVGVALVLAAGPVAAQEAQAEPPPQVSRPLHPLWAPLLVPAALVAPGVGHLLRGETRSGWRMLGASGVLLGVALGAGAGMVVSGAADAFAIPLVPLLMVVGSTYLTLGGADAVGAFSAAGAGVAPPARGDYWGRPWRAGVRYLWAREPALDQAHHLEALLEWRGERGWLGLEGGAEAGGGRVTGALGGGAHLVGWGGEPRAGLWLEGQLALAHEGRALHDTLRVRAQLTSLLPLGLLSPTLGRLTSLLRLGVQPAFTRFAPTDRWGREVYAVGGFELRWSVHPRARALWGYEHSREGPVGGRATGFAGIFYGGAELRLAGPYWLTGRALLGTPLGLQLGVERRW